MRTPKTEEVNGKTCINLEDVKRPIGAFLETVCNIEGLHSALGYTPPVEFEAELRRDNRNQANRQGALSPN